ncbi:MAG: CapA family protein, partial [Patescibacteria group bacterium]|nr:CapA family protein [Patescibacteria group bacterium]
MNKYLFLGVLATLLIVISGGFLWKKDLKVKEILGPNYSSLPKNQNEFLLPLPTLEKIFTADHQLPPNLDKERTVILIATGDIIPARSVNFQASQRGFIWPYEKTAEVLKEGDITFVNLESPLVSNCPLTQEGMVF